MLSKLVIAIQLQNLKCKIIVIAPIIAGLIITFAYQNIHHRRQQHQRMLQCIVQSSMVIPLREGMTLCMHKGIKIINAYRDLIYKGEKTSAYYNI